MQLYVKEDEDLTKLIIKNKQLNEETTKNLTCIGYDT